MAAALAGLSGSAAPGCDCNPLRACLSIAPTDSDAGATPGADGAASAPTEDPAPPARVCLEFVPPERG
jgi:hypothetical protein